jgi:hypothetical protein
MTASRSHEPDVSARPGRHVDPADAAADADLRHGHRVGRHRAAALGSVGVSAAARRSDLDAARSNVYRTVAGVQVDAPLTPFLIDPDGSGFGIRTGCTPRRSSSTGRATRSASSTPVTGWACPRRSSWCRTRRCDPRARVRRSPSSRSRHELQAGDVWHERQFPVAGVPLGLSPIAYGAMSIGTYLSAAQFAVDWFSNGSIPAGRLKNTGRRSTRKRR